MKADFEAVLRDGLMEQQRPFDGLLHPSGDLCAPLRHVQLKIAGAPQNENPLISMIRLHTGTMWHNWIETQLIERFGYLSSETELSVAPGLPEGWSGTADYVLQDPNGHYVLGDLKTTKGEGIKWIRRDGPKEDHVWQLSAYFWALVEMGYPMLNEMFVIYLPMNDVVKENVGIEIIPIMPLPKDDVWGRMLGRKTATDMYLASLDDEHDPTVAHDREYYQTSALSGYPKRVQKLYKERDGTFTLKLMPDWRAAFCPYDHPLCNCKEQGQTKIGVWSRDGGWIYTPRKGYELIEPEVSP